MEMVEKYKLYESAYFFNFVAKSAPLIGYADDIFASILALSDGNISSKIVLNKES